MTDEKPMVFDPDPTDIQMTALGQINLENLQASDLCTPEAVGLLVHIQRVTLAQLKSSKTSESRLALDKDKLQEEKGDLRVQIAKLQSNVHASWLEIPISLLTGFAINMLSSSPANTDKTVGWFMLVVGLFMLAFLRGGRAISAVLKAIRKTNEK
jgi:hypothetical protein